MYRIMFLSLALALSSSLALGQATVTLTSSECTYISPLESTPQTNNSEAILKSDYQPWVRVNATTIPRISASQTATLIMRLKKQKVGYAPKTFQAVLLSPRAPASQVVESMTWLSPALGSYNDLAIQNGLYQNAAFIGDLNADWLVDAADAGILFGNWGNSGVGDINADGIVDAADAGMMFAHWTDGDSHYTYEDTDPVAELRVNVNGGVDDWNRMPTSNRGVLLQGLSGDPNSETILHTDDSSFSPKVVVTHDTPAQGAQRVIVLRWGTSGNWLVNSGNNVLSCDDTVLGTDNTNSQAGIVQFDSSRLNGLKGITSVTVTWTHQGGTGIVDGCNPASPLNCGATSTFTPFLLPTPTLPAKSSFGTSQTSHTPGATFTSQTHYIRGTATTVLSVKSFMDSSVANRPTMIVTFNINGT